jgi:alkylhydroperoxidase family enzyme
MMRIPLWTPAAAERDPGLVAAIEQRRGGRLINLDRMLLWSEPLARSWNVFLRTLRQELSLSPKLRELAICVVARATGADYEFHHHVPEFEKAGGTAAQVAALDDPDAAAASPLFDDLASNVIRYALASTREVRIPETLFASLSRRLSQTELVELAAVVAGYNMVARFLVALQVPPEG